MLKGIKSNFTQINPLDTKMIVGEYNLDPHTPYPSAIMGFYLYYQTGVDINNTNQPLYLVYLPNKRSGLLGTSLTSIKQTGVMPVGAFDAQKEYSDQYILTDFEFAQSFLEFDNQFTAYELKLAPNASPEQVKSSLISLLPDTYQVLTLKDQHQSLYRIMRSEKFISYLILTLMLAIAAINIVGSLSMIVLEKTRDIAVLKSLGASDQLIRNIFLLEGLLVGGIGVTIGMILAIGLGLLQQQTGLIRLEGGQMAFPISMQIGDFAIILSTVLGLSVLAALYPSLRAARLSVIVGLRN